jgi:ribose transport system permease protein
MQQALAYYRVSTDRQRRSGLSAMPPMTTAGANLMGGSGTAFGAVLIETIRNSLTLLGINPFWQGTFVGTFIIVAVLFDRIRTLRQAE